MKDRFSLGTVARFVLFLACMCALPSVALAAAPQTFSALANQIVQVLGSATTDLIVLAIVVYFWGVSSSMFKGEKGRENIRQQLIWGVVVIFFAVSIWGIIQLLQSSIFNTNAAQQQGNPGAGGTCTGLNCQFGQN